MEDVKIFEAKEKRPVVSAKNVRMIYSENSETKAIIESPLMNRYVGETEYTEMPEGIKVVFYDSTGKINSRLKANYAIDFTGENRMEAKKDVVVINEKGEKLNTEHLIWDKAKRQIYTEVFVKITTPDKVFYGQGMESDERLENWKLKKASGTFNINTNRDNTSNPQ